MKDIKSKPLRVLTHTHAHTHSMTGLFEADIDSALQTDCGITETPGSPHFVSPPPGL